MHLKNQNIIISSRRDKTEIKQRKMDVKRIRPICTQNYTLYIETPLFCHLTLLWLHDLVSRVKKKSCLRVCVLKWMLLLTGSSNQAVTRNKHLRQRILSHKARTSGKETKWNWFNQEILGCHVVLINRHFSPNMMDAYVYLKWLPQMH